jgi:RecB family exonuclease
MAADAMTPVQARTLRDLIEPPVTAAGSGAERCRARLEEGLAALGLGGVSDREPLRISKGSLNDLEHCEGLFDARLRREGPPFAHSEQSAAGALFHKAIEVDVGSGQRFDVRMIAERAADRLTGDDSSFVRHWDGVDELDRFALLAEATRRIDRFRASFPSLGAGGAALPVPELKLGVELAGGRVVLSGKVDLVLLRPVEGAPRNPARLAVDLKTGAPRTEHAEDMRFYALLIALRYGVPPYRVATLFLESGEWQAEDVTDETLGRAADRVLAAARTALELHQGSDPSLRPGPWCAWCPRRETCPAVSPSP